MDECELKETCIFFNDKMSDLPSMAAIYKERYCNAEKSRCARYRVYLNLGREQVPLDLYPNQEERAEKIIGEQRP